MAHSRTDDTASRGAADRADAGAFLASRQRSARATDEKNTGESQRQQV